MQTNTALLKEKGSIRGQKKSRVIKLELEDPVGFKIFSAQPDEGLREGKGEILTFNQEGILLLTDKPLKEGSFLNLSFNIKCLGVLDDILGKVKRVEESEEHDFYVGVELYSSEQIKAEAISGIFPETTGSFQTKLKRSLLDHFNRLKESSEIKTQNQKDLTFSQE